MGVEGQRTSGWWMENDTPLELATTEDLIPITQ